MSESINRKVYSNMFWRLFERFGAQGVTFIVSLVLARILDPKTYGVLAIITVIITILQVFVDSGFGNALIQKKDSDDLDFSTVFYLNIAFSTILYIGLFFIAPAISLFYGIEELTLMVRVVGILLFISAFKNIQQAYVSKNLLFKKFFFSTIVGTISAAVVGIVMAVKGFGIWALIAQLLINNFMDTFILWITVEWKPKLLFSFKRLKELFGFGWKILVSSIITTTYNEIRQLIIGKMYTTEDLAYYNRGHQFPYYMTTNVNSAIDSVLFPTLSKVQNDKNRVKEMTRRSIKTSSFIIWPMMMGLAACSIPLIRLVLTEKWLPCVPYLVIFCVTYGMFPITTANLNAIKAMGKSDIYLILEIIKKSIGITALLITIWFGPLWIAIGGLIVSFISQIINAWPNKRILNYSIFDQLIDILPSLLLSVFMGGCVYLITFFNLQDWTTLLVQIPLGIFIYLFIAWLIKMESFIYLLNQLKLYFQKKKQEKKQFTDSPSNYNGNDFFENDDKCD